LICALVCTENLIVGFDFQGHLLSGPKARLVHWLGRATWDSGLGEESGKRVLVLPPRKNKSKYFL